MRHRQSLVSFTLFLCVFLAVFNEVLLSPFYPQFFRKVFGVEDLTYTGYYIFVCRLTVVLCAPIWGILSRNIEVKYLLYIGQAGAAIMTALMGTSNSAAQFLVYTIILLLFKSSYLLVYPLIIQLAGEAKRPTVAGVYQAVFHGAIVAGTIAGAGMVNFQSPLKLFFLIAIADVFQLIICIYVLQNVSTRRQDKQNIENAPAIKNQLGFIVAIGMVILSFQLANNLVRPYFTEYVTTNFVNINLLNSSLLFLIPSIMAIAALPYIRKACKPNKLPSIYKVGICLLVTSLFFQGWTQNIVVLILARVVYGFCLAVTQAALELQLFNSSAANRLHFNYSLAISFANVGHLTAPLMASWLVNTYSLSVPFIAAGVIGCVNLIFAKVAVFRKFSFAVSKMAD
ncbi:MAG: MFS transporter [Cyanobacteriota bacterium]|nr:MFS transporter [Cyanobacteriota bacterium]